MRIHFPGKTLSYNDTLSLSDSLQALLISMRHKTLASGRKPAREPNVPQRMPIHLGATGQQ
jgi:hypothetical protein